MNHIETKKLSALYQGTLKNSEKLELLAHMQNCEYCNTQFAAMAEANGLLKAPGNLKTAIIAESQSISTQMAMKKKKTTKQLELLVYSLKVSTAVVCTVLLLGIMNMNVLNSTFSPPKPGDAKPGVTITASFNQRSNDLATDFKNFSNKIINWR